MTSKKVNRRVVTTKGRSVAEWWEPLREYLASECPVILDPVLDPFVIPYSKHIVIEETDYVLVFARRDEWKLKINAICITAKQFDRRPPVMVKYDLFDIGLDTLDEDSAIEIADLLLFVCNGKPLSQDQQSRLATLMFST